MGNSNWPLQEDAHFMKNHFGLVPFWSEKFFPSEPEVEPEIEQTEVEPEVETDASGSSTQPTLADLFADCTEGWMNKIEAARDAGLSEEIAIEATKLVLDGNEEQADTVIGQALYMVMDNPSMLAAALNPFHSAKTIAIDTETYAPQVYRDAYEHADKRGKKRAGKALTEAATNPHLASVRLIQLAIENHPTVIIDLDRFSDGSDLKPLQDLLLTDSEKIFHNAKFDLQMFRSRGWKINGTLFDTMLAASLIQAGERDSKTALDDVAERYLTQQVSKEEQASDWSGTLTSSQLMYAARDASVLLPLRNRLHDELAQANLLRVAKIEFDCIWATAAMEYNGMQLDTERMNAYRAKIEAEVEGLKSDLYQAFGDEINLNSTNQLQVAFGTLGVNLNSTSEDTLMNLSDPHPCVTTLLAYKKQSRLVSHLTDLLEKVNPLTRRLHASYRQSGSVAGRFSCSKPNLQQVNRDPEVRACFVAEEGKKQVIADYSQIELRVAAEISRDSTMISAYKEGKDLHALTASLVSEIPIEEITQEQRQAAKAVNFGLIYGMGAKGLQRYAKNTYGVEMSLEAAELFKDRYFKAYSGVKRWHNQSGREVYKKERRTLCDRRRIWPDKVSFTAFVNTPVQGTAADILKLALGRLPKALIGTGAVIVASIHDEIILEVPEPNAEKAAKILSETMEAAGREVLEKVPVVAEARIADSWAEK